MSIKRINEQFKRDVLLFKEDCWFGVLGEPIGSGKLFF